MERTTRSRNSCIVSSGTEGARGGERAVVDEAFLRLVGTFVVGDSAVEATGGAAAGAAAGAAVVAAAAAVVATAATVMGPETGSLDSGAVAPSPAVSAMVAAVVPAAAVVPDVLDIALVASSPLVDFVSLAGLSTKPRPKRVTTAAASSAGPRRIP